MDKNWHKLPIEHRLDELELELRRGSRARAVARLRALARRRLPEAERVPAARLLRRAGLPALCLRVLGPWEEQRTSLARAEYGAALINLGAAREGARVLDALGGALAALREPRIQWIRAAARIREWDWLGAIPLLEGLEDQLESRMYLATCLIHGARDFERAERLLEEALREQPARLDAGDLRGVRSTAWLLMAQSLLLRGDLGEAERALARSQDAPAPQAGLSVHACMQRQWEWLLALRRATRARARVGARAGARITTTSRAIQTSLAALEDVRRQFCRLGAWEWARGCQLFAGELLGDEGALERLYWSTPYPAFRRRLEQRISPSRGYAYGLGAGTFAPPPHPLRGPALHVDQPAGLKPGQILHRTLQALAADLHRPHQLAELHERLHPEEGFRPESSGPRVHKSVQRLRAWLEQERLPLRIHCGAQGFALQAAPEGCRLILGGAPSGAPAAPALREWAWAARAAFGGRAFTAAEALERLGGARRTLARRLAAAREAGLLTREGSGPGSAYRAVQGGSRAPARVPWSRR